MPISKHQSDILKVIAQELHNTIISSIKRDGVEQLPLNDPKITLGYDDPRGYLPKAIVKLLDEELTCMEVQS